MICPHCMNNGGMFYGIGVRETAHGYFLHCDYCGCESTTKATKEEAREEWANSKFYERLKENGNKK